MQNNTRSAGRINGNPMCGLCERVCIAANKVFDGSIIRRRLTFNVSVSPRTAGPYSFVSATANAQSTVTNLVTSEQPTTRTVRTTQTTTTTQTVNAKSRVQFDTTTPISVSYTDADGTLQTSDSSFSLARDVLLTLPGDALISYEIEAATSAGSSIGTFNSDNTVTVTACVVQIVRVVAPVEILVPSYGYCEYPESEEYDALSCRGVFELPVFPD